MSLSQFHPLVARWFSEKFGEPTSAQRRGWAAVRATRDTLIAAPTGSGKTLAAFLTAIDDLVQESAGAPLPDEVRVVYVSPLKALSADIHKNLEEPLRGIGERALADGLPLPRITAAVRTGDTPQGERAAMLRTPPHILVTTPESLYLLLTGERSRAMLRTTRTVIVDEIHAVIGTRRGAHLALSLERLQQVAEAPLLRLGLSATQKPVEEVARFLVGAGRDAAQCAIVDEGHRRRLDLGLEIPSSSLEAVMAHEVWEEYYERLTQLIAGHRTTIVFVNTRRLAERVARHLSDRIGEDAVTAHHGSLSKETRLDAEARLKGGTLKALVATASLELGIDIGHVDLVCQIGSPHRIATLLQRVGRSGHTVSGTPKGRVFPLSRDDLIECAALLRSVRQGELDAIVSHDAPLDVLSQQVVAESACQEYEEDALFALVRRAWPYRDLARSNFDAVIAMTAEGFATRRGRRGALVHRDEVRRRVRGRRGARLRAITSGGAIPEVADYRVVLEPEDLFIGTLNEDFAIESMAGDVFQLGNASWRVLQVSGGVVRVADAKGAPPNIPFWLGEAPGRSDELSTAVSDLRAEVVSRLETETPPETGTEQRGTSEPRTPVAPLDPAIEWLSSETGISRAASEQAIGYLADGRHALGAMPTQATIVLERFFDESGGMQLVLHAPFGSRINKAWGLALRKRFCRQFNFELQAAATEEGLLLSLGPQHSFPLADVFRYLHPATAREVLVQAFLDAPVFKTRWRWNTTISLAVPRQQSGRKVPPHLQRMLADDLMAAVFPDAAACLENIPGDREIPDHPLVNQTVRDCLSEAMDFDGLSRVLDRIHKGDIQCVSRDTVEPSPFSHEILNARPYAFLDDAPLEERRTQAVYARRASEPGSDAGLGALDAAAVERVRDEQRIDARDADELHDALLTSGFLTLEEIPPASVDLFTILTSARRATVAQLGGVAILIAAERLPEILVIHPGARLQPAIDPPSTRTGRTWTREAAIAEVLRGRLAMVGPTTSEELAASLSIHETDATAALLQLESEGAILRGMFVPALESSATRRAETRDACQWCDRRLLARIHRYTLNRLRAEIEPATAADYVRFLFAWQHVTPKHRLSGVDGLRAILARLDGFELAASAWERSVLPARLDRYEPAMLDALCLSGEAAWARLSLGERASRQAASPVSGTPIALYLREHAGDWLLLRGGSTAGDRDAHDTEEHLNPAEVRVLQTLRARGASFFRDLIAACELNESDLRSAIARLVSRGLITSDGFSGLRVFVKDRGNLNGAGRWSALAGDEGNASQLSRRDAAVETFARALLNRYGVMFRRLLARESGLATWRELTRVYRRLEARGEIRGGRFVAGMSGEQFALPDAVERIREVRRTAPDGQLVTISAADPLNLAGILDAGERVRALAAHRLVYRDGLPLAAMEGDYIRSLAVIDPAIAGDIATTLAGRRVPPVLNGYVGQTR
jgi:ATP-dependent Lhr-like helicase